MCGDALARTYPFVNKFRRTAQQINIKALGGARAEHASGQIERLNTPCMMSCKQTRELQRVREQLQLLELIH